MNDDHLDLLVCQKNQNIRHYNWNEGLNKFTLSDTILASNGDSAFSRQVWIESRDYILIPDITSVNLQLKPYAWSANSSSFEPLADKVLEFDNETQYVHHSITKDKNLTIFTTDKATYIITGFDTIGEPNGTLQIQ